MSPLISIKMVEILPEPHLASNEDILCVCQFVLSGCFEWAYMMPDQNGVWMSAYAQHILDTFFEKNNFTKHDTLMKKSKMYDSYSLFKGNIN